MAFKSAQASDGSEKCRFSACFIRTEERILAENDACTGQTLQNSKVWAKINIGSQPQGGIRYLSSQL